jgi:hypothetical protein
MNPFFLSNFAQPKKIGLDKTTRSLFPKQTFRSVSVTSQNPKISDTVLRDTNPWVLTSVLDWEESSYTEQ